MNTIYCPLRSISGAPAARFSRSRTGVVRAGPVVRRWTSSRIEDDSSQMLSGQASDTVIENEPSANAAVNPGAAAFEFPPPLANPSDPISSLATTSISSSPKASTSTSGQSDLSDDNRKSTGRAVDESPPDTIEAIFKDLFEQGPKRNRKLTPSQHSDISWDAYQTGSDRPFRRNDRTSSFKPLNPYNSDVQTPFDSSFFYQPPRRKPNRDYLSRHEQEQFASILSSGTKPNDPFAALLEELFPEEDGKPAFPYHVRDIQEKRAEQNDYMAEASRAVVSTEEVPQEPLSTGRGTPYKIRSMAEEDFDRMKEEIARIPTDFEIWHWMTRTVFRPRPVSSSDSSTPSLPASLVSSSSSTSSETRWFDPTFPLIITYLLATFRDRFQNPRFSLALFSFVRSHSIESYLSGCSTSAYNEMLRTRWNCFRDLRGVEAGVTEMMQHGVEWNRITEDLVTSIIEEISRRSVQGHGQGEAAVVLEFGKDVFQRIARMEKMMEATVQEKQERHIQEQARRGEKRALRSEYRDLDMAA